MPQKGKPNVVHRLSVVLHIHETACKCPPLCKTRLKAARTRVRFIPTEYR
jgi:hypothetical protein